MIDLIRLSPKMMASLIQNSSASMLNSLTNLSKSDNMFSEFLILNEKGGIDFNLVRRILNILGSTTGLRRRFCFT